MQEKKEKYGNKEPKFLWKIMK